MASSSEQTHCFFGEACQISAHAQPGRVGGGGRHSGNLKMIPRHANIDTPDQHFWHLKKPNPPGLKTELDPFIALQLLFLRGGGEGLNPLFRADCQISSQTAQNGTQRAFCSNNTSCSEKPSSCDDTTWQLAPRNSIYQQCTECLNKTDRCCSLTL